ncbi:MAG TPA: YibE/F family protein [Peptococcaceae bacterium]|nr:YibE/F family protein [Peptococcaceae bacterium]
MARAPEGEAAQHPEGEVFRARVLEVKETTGESAVQDLVKTSQLITVEILTGPLKGKKIEVPNATTGNPAYDLHFQPGDQVILWAEMENGRLRDVFISDYARDRYTRYLAIAFILCLFVIGGRKGIKAVVTLGITGLAIAFVLLPLLLKGYNPIGVTVLVCAAVSALTFAVVGGINNKSIAAIIGTTGGVLVAGLLAFAAGTAARLTGFAEEEAAMLLYIPQETFFDFRGLLFAGIIIGALGAVMDVAMSIASAIEEVKKANPSAGRLTLVRAGMNVGKDVMGTMSNTLILAYTGSAIPMLLLFMAYQTPLLKVINLDLVATEIVRALAGSIGLIIAIPITALTAGFLINRPRKRRFVAKKYPEAPASRGRIKQAEVPEPDGWANYPRPNNLPHR